MSGSKTKEGVIGKEGSTFFLVRHHPESILVIKKVGEKKLNKGVHSKDCDLIQLSSFPITYESILITSFSFIIISIVSVFHITLDPLPAHLCRWKIDFIHI